MTLATVGSRYQVVIPREQRRRLGLKPKMKVDVEIAGDAVVIRPIPKTGWRGIGRDLYDGRDATDYVRELRAEWDTRR